jgi:hypothetical protein
LPREIQQRENFVAVAKARGQFGNPKKGERPLLEAVTRRLMNTKLTEQ